MNAWQVHRMLVKPIPGLLEVVDAQAQARSWPRRNIEYSEMPTSFSLASSPGHTRWCSRPYSSMT
jgi:hypothetical protein